IPGLGGLGLGGRFRGHGVRCRGFRFQCRILRLLAAGRPRLGRRLGLRLGLSFLGFPLRIGRRRGLGLGVVGLLLRPAALRPGFGRFLGLFGSRFRLGFLSRLRRLLRPAARALGLGRHFLGRLFRGLLLAGHDGDILVELLGYLFRLVLAGAAIGGLVAVAAPAPTPAAAATALLGPLVAAFGIFPGRSGLIGILVVVASGIAVVGIVI